MYGRLGDPLESAPQFENHCSERCRTDLSPLTGPGPEGLFLLFCGLRGGALFQSAVEFQSDTHT
ncbi:hypothetical protein BgiMline_005000, partial [Biomphalaria glabrata]